MTNFDKARETVEILLLLSPVAILILLLAMLDGVGSMKTICKDAATEYGILSPENYGCEAYYQRLDYLSDGMDPALMQPTKGE